jgi:hypothetical protein
VKTALVLTPWTGDGLDTITGYRPLLAVDHDVLSFRDVTCQAAESIIPDVNVMAVEIVCEDAVMAAIEASIEYGAGVLWSE